MAQNQTPVISTEVSALYRSQFVESFEGADGGALTLKCINGQELLLTTDRLAGSILWQAAVHGLKQKLVDAAAISRNPDTGRAASPDDKWAAVMEVYSRITGPEPTWNKTREGGAGGSGGLLFRALVRLYPAKTADQLREYLDGKSDAEKTALRKNPKVATVIEEIRAETGKAANVDTDELLNELED